MITYKIENTTLSQQLQNSIEICEELTKLSFFLFLIHAIEGLMKIKYRLEYLEDR
jgi:hypothetical protein